MTASGAPSGVVIDGRFVIERVAGMGGMGTVYRAFDRQTGGPVALKVLHGRSAEDLERFSREARVLAELRHPGIVRCIAHGSTSDDERYLALEWLEGESVADRLAREGMTIAQAVALGIAVADALAVAHQRDVVHRDIKPSNLFLPDGRIESVKILDFGVARMRSDKELTQTGALLGTPGYIAPEQARGERTVDVRADVFSLGCVLFKCVTGTPAFAGGDVLAVLLKVALDDAPRLRELKEDVPEGLELLIARMLRKAPRERPADAGAVAKALRDLGALAEGPAAPASTAAVALTRAERRVLCLVLSRLSSPRSELGPDDATLVSADVPSHDDGELSAIAARFGGSLDFIADSTVLVTITGEAIRSAAGGAADQAARAARCALAILAMHPGAPTVLVSGRGNVSARVPLGEVIERGARLLGKSGDGGVRLDEATAGLLDSGFLISGDGDGLVLHGERDVEETARTLLGKPTACVGRDRELAALEALFAEAASEPVARAVLVVSEAGLGKSRLRYEFLRRIKHRAANEATGVSGRLRPQGDWAPVEIWIGRGDPMGKGSPFAMIGAAIRRTAGVLDGEPPRVREQKLRARVGRHFSGSELDRVAAFLGELVGVPFADDRRDSLAPGSQATPNAGSLRELRAARADPVLLGDQTRRAFEDFLAAECAAQPVIIVLEDLHWGDLPTVKLIDSSLRNLRSHALLVLALARPEVFDLFPKLWSARGVTQLTLDELTPRASEELAVRALGATSTPEVIARVVERAGGNAFYLEELIRAVAEGKGDALPETVLAMAEARLESLDAEARRVLRAASVFGQVFWSGGVRALLGGDERAARLDEWLDQLADQEVLSHRAGSRFSHEREFVFRHAFVREAAYAMLTDPDKRLGHSLAGSWLDEVGERDALVLAEHFERGGEPGRAIGSYLRAAEQALFGNDFTAVVSRVESGIRCGAKGEALGALLGLEAEAHLWRGENADAERCALAAMDALPRGSALWYRAASEVATSSGRIGHHERLFAIGELLLATEPKGAMRAAHVVAATRTAARLLVSGRAELGEELLNQIERLARKIADADPGLVGAMRSIFAIRALCTGDPSAYLSGMELASEAYDRAGDRRNACTARVNCGGVMLEVGAYAGAARALEDGLRVSEEMGIQPIAALARMNLGLALARLGRIEEGAAVEHEAAAAFASQTDRRMEGASRIYLSAIFKLAGDLDAARNEARAAVVVLADLPPTRAFSLAMLADVELAAGRVEEARAAAMEAMAIVDSLSVIDEGESLARLVHAEVLEAAGDHVAAREAITRARDRVLARAERITVAAWRASFLEAIPENARTLELARAWLADSSSSA